MVGHRIAHGKLLRLVDGDGILLGMMDVRICPADVEAVTRGDVSEEYSKKKRMYMFYMESCGL